MSSAASVFLVIRACATREMMSTTGLARISQKKGGNMTKKGSVIPLDPKTDNVEVRPKKQVFAEAAAQLGSDQIEPPKQHDLLALPEQAQRPIAVQNGRMLATYVGLGLERDKDNEKLVHLDFSFPLEAAHDGFIPKKVKEAWEWLAFTHNKAIQIAEIPPITLSVYIDPKEKTPELHLVGAEFTKAIVQVIEEVGKGAAKMVWRFAFRLRIQRTKKVIDWAAWHDGDSFWLSMPATQKSMDPE